jgi:hypothetical protein
VNQLSCHLSSLKVAAQSSRAAMDQHELTRHSTAGLAVFYFSWSPIWTVSGYGEFLWQKEPARFETVF